MQKRVKWPVNHVYEVYWRDSCSSGGWKTLAEYRTDDKVGPMRSVGYLTKKDKHVVQLVQNMSSGTQHVADSMTIPRECVIVIKKLKR